MAFKPRGIPLDSMIDRVRRRNAASHQTRQEKMQCGSLPVHVADDYERHDIALLQALERLHAIDQAHPDLVASFAPAPATPTTRPASGA